MDLDDIQLTNHNLKITCFWNYHLKSVCKSQYCYKYSLAFKTLLEWGWITRPSIYHWKQLLRNENQICKGNSKIIICLVCLDIHIKLVKFSINNNYYIQIDLCNIFYLWKSDQFVLCDFFPEAWSTLTY